jgi:hypothetical protein
MFNIWWLITQKLELPNLRILLTPGLHVKPEVLRLRLALMLCSLFGSLSGGLQSGSLWVQAITDKMNSAEVLHIMTEST